MSLKTNGKDPVGREYLNTKEGSVSLEMEMKGAF